MQHTFHSSEEPPSRELHTPPRERILIIGEGFSAIADFSRVPL